MVAIADGVAIAKNTSYYQTDDLEYKFNVRKVFNIKTRENFDTNNKVKTKNKHVAYKNDVSEFVAKVKGGLAQAQRIALKFDLILVKKVFGEIYFLNI